MRQMKTRKKFAHVLPEVTKEPGGRRDLNTEPREEKKRNSCCAVRKNDPFQLPREETDAPPLPEISTFSQVF